MAKRNTHNADSNSDAGNGPQANGEKKGRKGPVCAGGILDPALIYTTRRAAGECERKDLPTFETALERAGVKLLRLGNGLTFFRAKDLWDKLGERD